MTIKDMLADIFDGVFVIAQHSARCLLLRYKFEWKIKNEMIDGDRKPNQPTTQLQPLSTAIHDPFIAPTPLAYVKFTQRLATSSTSHMGGLTASYQAFIFW